MTEMQIRRTTVTKVATGGDARVEITIADTDDIATARETVSLAGMVRFRFPNPSLAEIQIAALSRIRDALDEQLGALRGIAGQRH